jgi:hypothetical protein
MEGGSRNGAFLSEEDHCGGPLGRVPLLGTLEDLLRKALDMGISLYRGLHWGTWRGFTCWDFWEKRIVYLGSFLGPRGH